MRSGSAIPQGHDPSSPPPGVKLEGIATSLANLLASLGNTPQQQGTRYEELRQKLIFFFMRRSLPSPEDLADESLDRLARRVSEGVEIASIPAFALGIARYVAQEQAARHNRTETMDHIFWNNVPAHSATHNDDQESTRIEVARMEQCLKKLPSSDRKLIQSYYLAAQPRQLEARRKMAERLGLSANTLRQRVFLARAKLRLCLMTVNREVPDPKSELGKTRTNENSSSR